MKRIHIIFLSAALLLSLSASAQSFRSGYFLDNYVYGYRINPAQVNDRAHLGIALGNIDLQNTSTLGVSSLLYPYGHGLVTGLNKNIPADKFLAGLSQNNYIALDESINLFALGIANGKRMHTIEINVRAMNTENIPYDLLAFIKKGGTSAYEINGLSADVTALADVSYGFSTYILDGLSFGARLHFLVGLANVNLDSKARVQLAENRALLAGEAALKASGLISIGKTETGDYDLGSIGLGKEMGGYGGSIDLGVEYKSDFGLDAMISVTDLGMISWANQISANASAMVDFSGGTIGLEGNTVTTDFEDLLNLEKMFAFKQGNGEREMRMMPFNVAAGVRYFMPFYDKLSVGVLGTYHKAAYTSWWDARAGLTLSPARLISLTGNVGYGTFGPTWGAALNLHLGPINLLAGVDSYIGKLGRFSGIPFPVGPFMENAHIGLSLTF